MVYGPQLGVVEAGMLQEYIGLMIFQLIQQPDKSVYSFFRIFIPRIDPDIFYPEIFHRI
ncbi:hypothetical protein D9M68_987420 [compost metagenome]